VPNSIPSAYRAAQEADPYDASAGEENLPFAGPLTLRALGEATEEPSDRSVTEECVACHAADDEYVWVADRWRVRATRRPTGLPVVAGVHVHRWGDAEGHLRVWLLARPTGRPDLSGPYLPVWDRALPPVDEVDWRNRLGTIAVWLAAFGGRAVVAPPRLDWQPLPQLSGGLAAEASE
jgi:hypothetical protein